MRRRELLGNSAKYTFSAESYNNIIEITGGSITISITSSKELKNSSSVVPFYVSSYNGNITAVTVNNSYTSVTAHLSANTNENSSVTSSFTIKQNESGKKQTFSLKQNSGNGRGVYNGYEYVDLGLTGSAANLMFATCNIGASSESGNTAYGNYYQWGAGSTQYADTDQYHTGGTNTAYTLPMSADTARQVMGGDWRMPTRSELAALSSQTTVTYIPKEGDLQGITKLSKIINGIERYVIFWPCGYYYNGRQYHINYNGDYWTANASNTREYASSLSPSSPKFSFTNSSKNNGMQIRGVFKAT